SSRSRRPLDPRRGPGGGRAPAADLSSGTAGVLVRVRGVRASFGTASPRADLARAGGDRAARAGVGPRNPRGAGAGRGSRDPAFPSGIAGTPAAAGLASGAGNSPRRLLRDRPDQPSLGARSGDPVRRAELPPGGAAGVSREPPRGGPSALLALLLR